MIQYFYISKSGFPSYKIEKKCRRILSVDSASVFSISEGGVYYFILIHEDVGKISSERKGEEIENADHADSISDIKELKPSNLIMQSDTSTTEARRKSEPAHHNPHKGPKNV